MMGAVASTMAAATVVLAPSSGVQDMVYAGQEAAVALASMAAAEAAYQVVSQGVRSVYIKHRNPTNWDDFVTNRQRWDDATYREQFRVSVRPRSPPPPARRHHRPPPPLPRFVHPACGP